MARRMKAIVCMVGLALCPFASPQRAGAFIAPDTSAAMLLPGPGGFVAITPFRVADTRGVSDPTRGTQGGPVLSAGEVRTFTVTGTGPSLPPREAASVALNVTVLDPTGGYLSVWPADESPPDTSVVNFANHQTIANAVTVRVSPAGEIAVRSSSSAHLIIDVLGWYAPPVLVVDDAGRTHQVPSAGGGFFGLRPTRVYDSRAAGKFGDQEARVLHLAPPVEMAGTTMAAVVLNLTAVSPDGPGFATVVGPNDDPRATSTVNFEPRFAAVANQVTSKVGADGTVVVFTSRSVHLLVDLMGFYTDGAPVPGGYTPVTSRRLMDTRPPGHTGNASFDLVTGIWDLGIASTAGVPTTAAAVVINVTALSPLRSGYVAVWPDGQGPTGSSNLNLDRGDVRANAVTAGLGSNLGVNIFTDTDASMLVDVSGWFSSPYVAG
jgi:hypothetical protein